MRTSMKLMALPLLLAGFIVAGDRPTEVRPDATSMTRGAVQLTSAGPLTFADDGTLFVGDSYGAAVYALDLEEEWADASDPIEVAHVGERIASLLGTARDGVRIHDIAVSPVSRDVFVTVTRGTTGGTPIKNDLAPGGTAHLIRIAKDRTISEVDLGDVLSQKAGLEDVRSEAGADHLQHDRRAWNIVELAYTDGTLFVSGLSNEEWSAKLRRLAYPFHAEARSSAFRIFHTAHGRYETGAPARVFVPYEHDGALRIFAGFSCTPLVDLSVAEMDRSERVEGKTIAELGAGNHVLDMIGIERNGDTYFLLANRLHDFMRLKRSDFDGAQSLTRPTNRAGIERTPLRSMDAVTRLSSDRDERVVVLEESDGDVNLRTVPVEALLR